MIAERLDLWRLANFTLERVPSDEDVHLFRAVARENRRDERLVAVGEVRDLAAVRDERGRVVALPALERTARQAFEAMRAFQSRRRSRERLHWNRVMLYAWPVMEFEPDEARAGDHQAGSHVGRAGAGDGAAARPRPRRGGRGGRPAVASARSCCASSTPRGRGVGMEIDPLPTQPLQPLDEGAQRIVSARRRGLVHPAEILKVLAPGRGAPGAAIPPGEFTEYDFDADGELAAGAASAGHQHRGHRGGARAQPDRALPGGDAAGGPARRSDALAGVAGGARVPADHRRARSRRAPRGAVRMVRAVGRRQDRDGLRDREHGLGGGGAAPDRALHPGRAARSTSWSAASTSAPSRTGTPRRRC